MVQIKHKLNICFKRRDIVYKLYIGISISAQIIPFTNSIRKKRLVKNFLITSGERIVWGISSIVVRSETPDSRS